MKKNLLLLGLLVAAPFALNSCGDSADPAPTTPTVPTAGETALGSITLPAPANQGDAMALELQNPEANDFVELGGERFQLQAVEFTEGGDFVMRVFPEPLSLTRSIAPKDEQAPEYRVGKYTVQVNGGEKVYVLDNQAQVKVTGSGANLSLTLTGATGAELLTANATRNQNANSGTASLNLCRTWSVQTTTVEIDNLFPATMAMRFTGCNLQQILESVSRYARIDAEEIAIPREVTGISFTSFGSFYLLFSNAAPFVGGWSWKDQGTGFINYNWTSGGYSFENGEAYVSVVNNNLVKLRLGVKVEGTGDGKTYTGFLTMLLKS